MPEETLLLLTPIGIIFAFAIKEFFSYLKIKKIGNGNANYDKELALINQKLDNHIEHISQAIIQINASLKQNTKDTNEIQKDIIIIKERLK